MNTFLETNQFLKDRLDMNIDVHPSDIELKEFQKIAKVIDPQRYFSVYGCQSCVNDLIRFVYNNQKTFISKETFPKADAGATKEI